jgi:hypothetical protein
MSIKVNKIRVVIYPADFPKNIKMTPENWSDWLTGKLVDHGIPADTPQTVNSGVISRFDDPGNEGQIIYEWKA